MEKYMAAFTSWRVFLFLPSKEEIPPAISGSEDDSWSQCVARFDSMETGCEMWHRHQVRNDPDLAGGQFTRKHRSTQEQFRKISRFFGISLEKSQGASFSRGWRGRFAEQGIKFFHQFIPFLG